MNMAPTPPGDAVITDAESDSPQSVAAAAVAVAPTAAEKRVRDDAADEGGGGDASSVGGCGPSGADDNKRCKTTTSQGTAMSSLVEVYVCPLTKELPVDPVTADDGRVYERWAIEKRIRALQQGEGLKSPVTSEPMGLRLTDAVQVRNSIRMLIDSGAIHGEPARQWVDRVQSKSVVEETEQRAEEGDVKAMFNLAVWYHSGRNGLTRDEGQAFHWYKRAAEQKHDPICMSNAGTMLIFGQGVKRSVTEGMVMKTAAAGMGVDVAAYQLGLYYYKGRHGLTRNPSLAKFWLKRAVDGSCNVKRMTEEHYNIAMECLCKLNNN